MTERTPSPLVHVGLCVDDLDAAIAWYREVFQLELVVGPTDVRVDDPEAGPALADVFGPDFRHARVGYLRMGDGAGIELFQFVDPPTLPQQTPCYWRPGFSHVCFVAPDLDALAERIETSGGRVRTRAWTLRPGEPFRFLHFEDPFGNLLELHSHSGDETFGRASRD